MIDGCPASFFFPEFNLVLTTYVDDLVLAGPTAAHDVFWSRLRPKVEIEDPTPLDRILGRHHRMVDGSMVFDMAEYCRQSVDHYKEMTGVSKLKAASTPYAPEGSLPPSGEDVRGTLSDVACSCLMKFLWVARLARPDLFKAVCDMTAHVSCWSSNDDKRLFRLACYLDSSVDLFLLGKVADDAKDVSLLLCCGADFGGDQSSARSTSAGVLFLSGPKTLYPIAWLCKRQTSTSRSTTESEVVSIAHSLFGEALPMMGFFDKVLRRNIHLLVREDNQATIRIVKKGFSAKLRHITRTHKINLSSIKEEFDKGEVEIEYVDTNLQVADFLTKPLAPQKWPNALDLMGMRRV